MNLKPHPYIGVTGVTTAKESQQIADFLHKDKPLLKLNCYSDHPFVSMLGITCSNKRLKDPTSKGKTSPSLYDLIPILEAMPSNNCISMMHYFTDNPENLLEEIKDLMKRPLPIDDDAQALYPSNCRAIQINQKWPDPSIIKQIQNNFTEKQKINIVIQLPASVLQDPISDIVEKAKLYDVDYLLIDPSGGTGEDFNLEQSGDLLIALDDALPKTRIGVAGGFSAENVEERVLKLYEKVERVFCIDAQGKLRTEDKLDMNKVSSYIKNACKALRLIHGRTDVIA